MSNLLDLAPVMGHAQGIRRGVVSFLADDGCVCVALDGLEDRSALACEVLNPDTSGSVLAPGDVVLVWAGEAAGLPGQRGVVLGKLGPHVGSSSTVADPAQFASRPVSLVIETQGELVLRNGKSRIRLGAEGDVEISCTSFATRSQRLLRLLAPLIKLN
jgi:hypothetical protein